MVEKITLKNGMRVLHEKLPGMRSCALGLWVESGSRHEPPELCGVSHFIEHMLFKGTATHTAAQLAEEFDGIGGQVNAFTSKENTCYYSRTLDIHLAKAVDLLCDMFFNSKFDKADVDLERTVIIEEIGMYEDSPEDLVNELLTSSIYDGCSLGRPILGTKETLKAMDGNTLSNYCRNNYTTENTLAVLCGSYSDEDLQSVCRHFENMPAKPAPDKGEGVYEKAVVMKKKDTEQNHLIVAFPGIASGSGHRFDMQILNNVLGGGMSSRLFQKVREQNGLCYSIYSFSTSYLGTGLVGIYTALSAETELSALSLIKEEIDNFLQDGITEQELSRSREQLKASMLMGLESNTSRMTSVARNEFIYGTQMTEDDIVAGFDNVSRDSVMALAKQVFNFERMSFAAVGQIKAEKEYMDILKPSVLK